MLKVICLKLLNSDMKITIICFYPWATIKPVTKVSLARWHKTIHSLSGIDTTNNFAHSYRGASLSSAYNKGVSLNDILKAGAWTNTDNFINHYYVHASDTPVGQIILNESP